MSRKGDIQMISDKEHRENLQGLLKNLKGYETDDFLKAHYLFELSYLNGEISKKKYDSVRRRVFGNGGLQ